MDKYCPYVFRVRTFHGAKSIVVLCSYWLIEINDDGDFKNKKIVIADALLVGNGSLIPSDDAVVIFDESRHQQSNPLSDTYNLAYYFLVYFTNDWMAMLILFLALFMMLEVVLIRKEDPEDWRHVFRIIYYGFGDAKRYEFYQHPDKIRPVSYTHLTLPTILLV